MIASKLRRLLTRSLFIGKVSRLADVEREVHKII